VRPRLALEAFYGIAMAGLIGSILSAGPTSCNRPAQFFMGFKKGSDEEIQDKAREKIRGLFLYKPIMARWLPVMAEQQWVLLGRQNASEHKTLLPDYCYKIFDLYGRTLYKSMFTVPETFQCKDPQKLANCKTVAEAKPILAIDWEKAGSVSGSGLRAVQFVEQQLEGKLQELGMTDLSEKQMDELDALLTSKPWLEDQFAKLQPQFPGKSVEEISEVLLSNQAETIKNFGPYLEKVAFEWGPDALAGLKKGQAKGAIGFLDVEGNVKGERKLKHSATYELLLMAWPEIEAMLRADPPQRMEDLWNWLTPFSYAGWIEITDLDQLVSLCRPIKLKLKKPGAPRKSKKC
jgi:hypothetical protein